MKLRFSIRDLLWLTLVLALVVGWWIDREHNRKTHVAELGGVLFRTQQALSSYRMETIEKIKRAFESAGERPTAEDITKELEPETF